MVSERSLQVLHAIVSDFVASNEPVGSKTIVERHSFGVSAATIRNDMALLEEEDLIVAPHTSSGRIPTDKGYRLYVDTLTKLRPLSTAQRSAIEAFLTEPVELEDLMARTVRLLAQLTNQVAVIQYPSLVNTVVRHVELVSVSDDRILCVIITGAGVVEQQIARLHGVAVSEEWIRDLRDRILAAIGGQSLAEASTKIEQLRDTIGEWVRPDEIPIVSEILDAVIDGVAHYKTQRITIAGAANLTKREDFSESLPSVLEAIEEQVTLLRLFGELVPDMRGVGASIGRENTPYGLEDAAVVAAQYQSSGDTVSRLGVLGPTRMDYAGNIAAARAVARYLSNILGDSAGR